MTLSTYGSVTARVTVELDFQSVLDAFSESGAGPSSSPTHVTVGEIKLEIIAW